jgi:hypothetical protein
VVSCTALTPNDLPSATTGCQDPTRRGPCPTSGLRFAAREPGPAVTGIVESFFEADGESGSSTIRTILVFANDGGDGEIAHAQLSTFAPTA